jgi:hypothetical protein
LSASSRAKQVSNAREPTNARLGDLNKPLAILRLGPSRLATPVSQPAQAVGRFE